MKLRFTLTAAFAVCLAATAVAQTADIAPLQVLFTKEEAASFKSRTPANLQALVDLFWARRDPTPATPVNEYRQFIEALVQYADTNFKGEKARGALTERGRTLLVYGQPKRAARATPEARTGSFNAMQDQAEQATITWTYEGDAAKAVFGTAPVQLTFSDRMSTGEYKLARPRFDLVSAQQRAIARVLTQPGLTAAPVFAATAAAIPRAAPVPAPAAAPATMTALTTESLKSAIAEFKAAKKNPYEGKAYAQWGEYVTSYGEYFVPVGLYLPKSAGVSGDVTYFGIVEDAAGQSVLAFEEAATLIVTKDDFYIDKSLKLPAGKHRGTFGVAQNGKVVALTSTEMELAGAIDKEATGISQLIISNNVFPLTAAQKANDPYSFGGVRVVPKADRKFRPSDELWYFFELRNPGVTEPALAEGTVAVNPTAVAQVPKIQVKIDVAGKDKTGKVIKMSAPPSVADAIEMRGVPGHFGVGSAIPLTTFKPGDYSITIKVIDTIKKSSHTLTEKFTIVE